MQSSDLISRVAADHKTLFEKLAGRPMQEREVETLVAAAVGLFFEAVVANLKTGTSVAVRRFGRFETRWRQPRTIRPGGRYPAVDVPARPTVGFVPSAALKTDVRSKEQGDGNVQQHLPARA